MFADYDAMSRHFKNLYFQFSPEGIQNSWSKKHFQFKKINNVATAKCIDAFNGGVVFATFSGEIKSSFWFPEKIDSNNDFELKIKSDLNIGVDIVTCIAVDNAGQYVVAGMHDRHLTLWNLDKGILVSRSSESHGRSISCVKIYENSIFSSSIEDHHINIWTFDDVEEGRKVKLSQSLDIFASGFDIRNNCLVTAHVIGNFFGVWTKKQNSIWTIKIKIKISSEEYDGAQDVIILKKMPTFGIEP
jgi:WD40 repeat protein